MQDIFNTFMIGSGILFWVFVSIGFFVENNPACPL